MLSIVIPIRNATAMASMALQSVWSSIQTLRLEAQTEIIAIDDASDADRQIPQLIQNFRRIVQCPVLGFKLRERRHYTYACALGFSVARGRQVLMISHDMIATPAYVRTLMAVAALDPSHGVVRGTSAHVDCFPQHVVRPTLPTRSFGDIVRFSDFIANTQGLTFVEDDFLIGDSMLITRTALDRVGVMDTAFVGFLGDVDFGLRVQHAGLKLICAKGAWLHHEGSGLTKAEVAAGRADATQIGRMHQDMVAVAYGHFRQKWDATIPEAVNLTDLFHRRLRSLPIRAGGEFVPPITLGPEEGDTV